MAPTVDIGLGAYGYDLIKGNPYDSNGDPGFREAGRIFQTGCTKDEEQGYWDYVNVEPFLNCETDMKSYSYSSYFGYLYGRSSSLSFASSAEYDRHINFFGLTFGSYAKYAASRQYETSRVSALFFQYHGEIVEASAECLTNTVGFDTVTSRPLFTQAFINALYTLDSVLDKPEEDQKRAYKNFVLNYGTHYLSNVQLGASTTYHKRFYSGSASFSESYSRKSSFQASVEACHNRQSSKWWGLYSSSTKYCLAANVEANSSLTAAAAWSYQASYSDLTAVSKGSILTE